MRLPTPPHFRCFGFLRGVLASGIPLGGHAFPFMVYPALHIALHLSHSSYASISCIGWQEEALCEYDTQLPSQGCST